MVLPDIGCANFRIAGVIIELSKGRRRVDWIRVEDRGVENVI
jgi:hypothetical protein